jgi:cystathionine gamma-synthase
MGCQLNLSALSRTVQIGTGVDERTGAVSFPIYPSATYRHPGVGQSTGYDYTRSGNPTRTVLEEALADLEGGARGLAFSSGMAALTTLFLHFSAGDHLVVSEDLYGGTYRVLDQVFGKFGLLGSVMSIPRLLLRWLLRSGHRPGGCW